MSLSGIIHHSHLFTRLKIYHHIYFKIALAIILINLLQTDIRFGFCSNNRNRLDIVLNYVILSSIRK